MVRLHGRVKLRISSLGLFGRGRTRGPGLGTSDPAKDGLDLAVEESTGSRVGLEVERVALHHGELDGRRGTLAWRVGGMGMRHVVRLVFGRPYKDTCGLYRDVCSTTKFHVWTENSRNFKCAGKFGMQVKYTSRNL